MTVFIPPILHTRLSRGGTFKSQYQGTQLRPTATTGRSSKGLSFAPLLQQVAVARDSVAPHCYNRPQWQGAQFRPAATTGRSGKGLSFAPLLQQAAVPRDSVSRHCQIRQDSTLWNGLSV